MELQAPTREVVVSHQKPRRKDHILAFNLLRDAGYQVEATSARGGELILVVNDPVYHSAPGSRELLFSHNETVHLRTSVVSSLLMGAVHFIYERS